MPFTVVTLKKSPASLRGDLTKWMQEIATGVYVGNVNSKIRERLWQRIQETVADGEATISYACRNEIGYYFFTHKTQRTVVDWEGIPLILIPHEERNPVSRQYGFSNAAKFRQAKRFLTRSSTGEKIKINNTDLTYIILDIETDGLEYLKNEIIEIGALKISGTKSEEYKSLISYTKTLPRRIIELTGISENMLQSEGRSLDIVLKELQAFLEHYPIIGYNIGFDMKFLNAAMERHGLSKIGNTTYDLKKYVKRDQPLLKNYKLQTVLDAYQIGENVGHRAISDCRLTNELAKKVNGFLEKINENA